MTSIHFYIKFISHYFNLISLTTVNDVFCGNQRLARAQHYSNKNSSGDEIANVNLFTTTS